MLSTRKINIRPKLLIGIFTVSLLSSFALYFEAIYYPLSTFDSQRYILENPCTRAVNLDNFLCILTEPYFSNWQPITLFSYMLEYSLFGNNPVIFHTTNITLHGINVFLVFLLSLQLLNQSASKRPKGKNESISNLTAAFITATIFLIHPQHVESVAWVAERKGLLAFLFVLITLVLNHKIKTDETTHQKYKLIAFVCYILAATSKPTVISVPFVLVILDRLFYSDIKFLSDGQKFELHFIAKSLYERKYYIFVAISVALMNYYSQNDSGAVLSFSDHSVKQRLFNVLYGSFFYIEKFLIPINLHPYYVRPSFVYNYNMMYFSLYAALFIFTTGLCLYTSYKNTNRYLLVWTTYLVLSIPTIGLLQAGIQVAADRYAYLTTLPFYLALSFLISAALYRNRSMTLLAFLGFSTIFSIQAKNQIYIWTDDLIMWTHVKQRSENESNHLAEYSLGYLAAKRGDYNEAVRFYELATSHSEVKMEPRFSLVLAKAYLKTGKIGESLTTGTKILNDPDSNNQIKRETAIFLKKIFLDLGETEEVKNIEQYISDLEDS